MNPFVRTFAAALACAAVAACGGDSTGGGNNGGNKPGAPAGVAATGGTSQNGTVGAALAAPLVVRVTDAQGRGVPNVAVSWSITAGNGSVAPAASTTDASGNASTTWTLGTAAGAQSVSASVGALPAATFSATAAPGPVASLLLFSGGNQLAVAGQQQAQDLVWSTGDAYGNPVPGVTLNFTASAGAGLTQTSATTDASGKAATRLIVGDLQPGAQIYLTATAPSSGVTANTSFYARRMSLVFVRGDGATGQVYAMDWVNRGLRPLTPASEDASLPALSPTGSAVAYSRYNATTGNYDMVLRNLATNTAAVVYSSANYDLAYARFSPTGDSLVFTGYGTSPAAGVRTFLYVRSTGALNTSLFPSAAVEMANPGVMGYYVHVSFGSNYDLYVRNGTGGVARLTSTAAVSEMDPAWGSATRILYTCAPLDANGLIVQADLCAINVDGSSQASVLQDPNFFDYNPTVSPDKAWLAWASQPVAGGANEIAYASIVPGTSGAVSVVTGNGNDLDPNFGYIGWTPGAAFDRVPDRGLGVPGKATPEARARLARAVGHPVASAATAPAARRTGAVRPVF